MDPDLRTAVYDRSQGTCDWCGIYVYPDGWDFHHRKLRSRGGDDSLANGACLCHPCHMLVHRYPRRSTRFGFMVSGWEDPERVPLFLQRRRWVYATTYDLIN